MKFVKIAAGVLVALILGIAITAVAARYSDGPIGIFPGGPLEGGEEFPHFIVAWSWARNFDTIELQLEGDDTSRTTWFIEHNGLGYIPASTGFPPGKTWHTRADGSEAWLRIDGKRYQVKLDRFEDEKIEAELRGKVERKYGGGPGGDTWWFKVTSIAPIPTVRF